MNNSPGRIKSATANDLVEWQANWRVVFWVEEGGGKGWHRVDEQARLWIPHGWLVPLYYIELTFCQEPEGGTSQERSEAMASLLLPAPMMTMSMGTPPSWFPGKFSATVPWWSSSTVPWRVMAAYLPPAAGEQLALHHAAVVAIQQATRLRQSTRHTAARRLQRSWVDRRLRANALETTRELRRLRSLYKVLMRTEQRMVLVIQRHVRLSLPACRATQERRARAAVQIQSRVRSIAALARVAARLHSPITSTTDVAQMRGRQWEDRVVAALLRSMHRAAITIQRRVRERRLRHEQLRSHQCAWLLSQGRLLSLTVEAETTRLKDEAALLEARARLERAEAYRTTMARPSPGFMLRARRRARARLPVPHAPQDMPRELLRQPTQQARDGALRCLDASQRKLSWGLVRAR